MRIASLERALLYAGAALVLASLWTATDPSARALIEHFYHDLAGGHDEVAALQLAKLDLIKEFGREADPFH
jgi:CHAT domain-containing protein